MERTDYFDSPTDSYSMGTKLVMLALESISGGMPRIWTQYDMESNLTSLRDIIPSHSGLIIILAISWLWDIEIFELNISNRERSSSVGSIGFGISCGCSDVFESRVKVDDVPLDDVPSVIGNYHICVVKNKRLAADILSRAKQMKLVMQFGVGLEGVDIDAATKLGIKVARIPGDNEMEVSVKQKKLGEPTGDTLLGKTVFILGSGKIGMDLAKRLRPFGVNIIATKPSASPVQDGIGDDLVDEKGAGIVNERFISSMEKGVLLINIARGVLLDYEAVKQNLESGQLVVGDAALHLHAGASLPVIEFVN
ncbi:hypothetical protein CDL15_Pgr022262 [Punica granatum]|uniref:D-isomer specific 2-hydroxyacid dehydrogenase NAD-binding domain-containing protein n=1 Tax=Punica granatum TaxID=22663 RepID=A0A218WP25_PUNGR|nr:hypothetical protein CDL15_Pgr022262 [Punica granatum]